MPTRVASLASLLKTADELIAGGSEKIAAKQESSIEKIAEALEAVSEPVEVRAPSQPETVDMDKLAEAINVLDTAAEIEMFKRMETFEEKAKSEGYTEEQIGEAMSKVAAARLKKSLPVMVALGFGLPKGKKPSQFIDRLQAFTRQPAVSNAKTQGY